VVAAAQVAAGSEGAASIRRTRRGRRRSAANIENTKRRSGIRISWHAVVLSLLFAV
jgi:hypothetical protein